LGREALNVEQLMFAALARLKIKLACPNFEQAAGWCGIERLDK